MNNMLIKTSTAGLQNDLRDTMRTYTEEKHNLRAQLSTLRLDLSQLHRDDRTVSSEEQTSSGASHVSYPASDMEPELRRLVEDDDEEEMERSARHGGLKSSIITAPALQLPALKGMHSSRTGADGNTNKSLRFCSNSLTSRSEPKGREEKDDLDGSISGKKSFLKEDNWWRDSEQPGQGKGSQESKEQQKFKELQRNQDMLRNIGRANLREKRFSLIRLPTITSAKKRRQTTWDSGKNVSRPAGKSTTFETHPYVEASLKMRKTNLKIPAIRDSRRSEILLDPDVPRQPDPHKKKVQFTRPGELVNTSMLTTATGNPNLTMNSGGLLNATSLTSVLNVSSLAGGEEPHNESVMGGESLNTTLADTTMGDTSFLDISFDHEQIKAALAQRGSMDKTAATVRFQNSTHRHPDGDAEGDASQQTQTVGGALKPPTEPAPAMELTGIMRNDLPPVKMKSLVRKNVILHDLNTSGVSAKLREAGQGNWDKASDVSVLTKISRLSLETEEWKNSYMSMPDPDKRNKTLSDIMFAVRSRMRENEASLRFGETPRPSDEPYDLLLPDPFEQHNSPRRAGKSPRKLAKGQTSRSVQLSPPKRRGGGGASGTAAGDTGGKTAAQLQGYLRKVYRHRRGAGAAGPANARNGKGGEKGRVQKPCGTEASKFDRHTGMRIAMAQEA